VILDVFSRYVIGWMVAAREAARLAARLLAQTICAQGIQAQPSRRPAGYAATLLRSARSTP